MFKEQKFTGKIMGTQLIINVVTSLNADCDIKLACDLFDDYERRFSRFRDESELSRLNKEREKVVSPEFMEVFNFACSLYYQTDGVFNPLCCPCGIGYDRDFDLIDSNKVEMSDVELNVDFSLIEVNGNRIVLKEGQFLDFGGFLKGYVAQKAARFFQNYEGFYISVGGDIVTGGRSVRGDDFSFAVLDPKDGQKYLDVLKVRNQAVATSGSYKRHWKSNGVKKHHILDPFTKNCSESDLISVTVVCDDGAKADAFATVVLILGSKRGIGFLREHGCKGVLVDRNYSLTKIE